MKGSRGKVDLPELIEWVLIEIRDIDNDPRLEQKRKTRAHERLAKKVRTKLYEDGRRKDEDKLTASSYRRYLTRIRTAITEQNWMHHGLEQSIDRLARRHPKYADRIRALGEHDNITNLRLAHRELLTEVRALGDSSAYDDLAKMKLDHEIMRHLTLSGLVKSQLAGDAVERIETKAHNTVTIGYHSLMSGIADLLARRQQDEDGRWVPVMNHVTLGLALATGRRSWEVLVLGRFKKVGDFELEFSGQAKKRGGLDYSESYRIYTLVAADVVMEALEKLRALPEIVELQTMDQRQFNNRTHSSLNRAAKTFFDDPKRVFKDSRPIWARVVFELHFTRDQRWKRVNESVFWREMLGHEDMDTQETYKQFKIDYTQAAESREKGSEFGSRLEALQALDEHEDVQARGAMKKIHAWVKQTIAEAPEAPITQSLITREVGSGRQVIKDYLELADSALSTPNRSPDEVAFEVPPDVAEAKPRLTAHVDADGSWTGVATINGIEVARCEGCDSRINAMRCAYDAACT